MDDLAHTPEPSEEHRLGSLLLAVASLSHQGYVKLKRGARGVWRVSVYSPRPRAGLDNRHPHLSAAAETLREALEATFERLRAEQARLKASPAEGAEA